MYEPTNIYTPKDKNTNNNLVDWYYPEDIEQNSLIFNQSIKEQLDNIVKEYSNRDILSDLGLDFENRLLLCGPPGCGKTSTAFLLSKLLNLPLAYVRLDSLISSLLGQTGSNIRKIFDSVNKKNVILFLDEFDAIAKKRDDNHELGIKKKSCKYTLAKY
ncbi:AAA family ATPase [Paenibacillus sp. WLX1005]|uniref:AAA family ATPase n=1 Tax=Paenibacillus sp. WLX1005 TaxID=3243766 RepID=UPI0039843841